MNILVTGATGLIGRALVLRLQRDGHRVTAWVRDRDRARGLLGPDVALVGDAPRPGAALDGAVSCADAVVNLAGAPVAAKRWTRRRRRVLRASRVEVTRALVEAIARSPSRPRVLVSASGVGYYGAERAGAVDETAAAGDDFLARLCAAWERAAREAEDVGVRVVTLRFGIVLAGHGGALAAMLPLFRARAGARLGHGRQPVPWIHLRDAVEVAVLALTTPRLSGPVNAVAPEPATNAELTAALVDRIGGRAWWVPGLALRATLGARAAMLLGGQAARPDRLERLGFDYHFPTLAGALDDILCDARGVCIAPVDAVPDSPYLAQRGASHALTQRTVIAAPLHEVFTYFCDPGNLSQLTPPDMQFEITSSPAQPLGEGTVIDYRIAVGPVPLTWRTVFEVWQTGRRFVDVQDVGPYRSWWHEHRFVADGDRTIMEDRVVYALPLGPIGRLVHRLRVASMLRAIFRFRADAIAYRFARPPAEAVATRDVARGVAS